MEIKLTKKEMEESVVELEGMVCMLWGMLYDSKKVKVKGLSRKEVLLSILMNGGLWSVKELSGKMSEVVGKEISSRNVSSLLSYLRDDIEKGKIEGELVRIGRGVGKLKFVKEEV